MTRPVLLIGGMDSSGGAGLGRDLLAVHDAGLTARIAVTAVTAQTDREVLAVEPVSPEMLAAQIDAALEGGIGAVKIGVLCNAALIRSVAGRLPDVPIVLDPVVCSSSGHALLEPEAIITLIDLLLPRATVLTPNLPELAALKSALQMNSASEHIDIVKAILERGCQSVLVKGGHDGHPELSTDILYQEALPSLSFCSPRYQFDLRGTGCHLASGLAAALAEGKTLPEAIKVARHGLAERFRIEFERKAELVR
ncbi:MAG: bifunctional hydroxymethylpyrimidine kinase/phosphomethylpyrimidine kinase [Gluconobacter potus]|uniref:hydroxymethylpyrimidine kinase n=1 Tax=Gluconobacter potus TaxID=2724927 RepID=A0ABR9YJT3_9PROT|nr:MULTISPECIES: bifunctional hydroxymethylpyrimidine kinase/phosphomethylpyrimidine kinase [Gluconobacter]MBF0864229.1 hydroxymethylpyrimidine/phosphomethylpyrimidine kinase [Gluconobacter sp. R71656]MBF0867889.1 hydroxymethylpyrimidine/phosphomethylpyrimidine kinase [Gluconobacter sp. R75628]MBF0872814.1 hydroxymethylpyrimidine/phosphomethylpyrimidine kinase [Gluconobacter sp. R75629]MBF0882060.1 hydroxymethylpyrimidine/phosphomethylpyrimidine kinase [Gluconobacter potus]